MELILFLFLAGLTVFLSIKLSYYADLLNKSTNIFIIRITPYYSNLNPYLMV